MSLYFIHTDIHIHTHTQTLPPPLSIDPPTPIHTQPRSSLPKAASSFPSSSLPPPLLQVSTYIYLYRSVYARIFSHLHTYTHNHTHTHTHPTAQAQFPGDGTLHKLDDPTGMAKCLDGTPMAYYHRPGYGSGATKWLLSYEGVCGYL
jgi:hypothetical protein